MGLAQRSGLSLPGDPRPPIMRNAPAGRPCSRVLGGRRSGFGFSLAPPPDKPASDTEPLAQACTGAAARSARVNVSVAGFPIHGRPHECGSRGRRNQMPLARKRRAPIPIVSRRHLLPTWQFDHAGRSCHGRGLCLIALNGDLLAYFQRIL